jgi:predicted transcriptional regulator
MSSQQGAEPILSRPAGAEKLFYPNRTESEWVDELRIDDPAYRDVLETVFGLRTQTVATYAALLEEAGQTTDQLAERFDRDRSNVNRWLSELHEAGLVFRNRRIPETGGFFYEYYPIPESTREAVLKEAIEQWKETAVDAVAAEET